MDITDQIKAKLPLETYVPTKLRKQGRTLTGLCPLHSEKTPSFVVWPDQDSWRCFGCGQGGDIFTLYQLQHNCDFKTALKELAHQAGVELKARPEDIEAANKHRRRSGVLADALAYYRTCLKDEHNAYLRKRGFTDEFIAEYGFGYAPGSTIVKALSQYDIAELQATGLVNNEGRDFFWSRIIIPTYGYDGEVVNLTGRAIGDGVPKYLRLPGETQVINEQALRKAETVYICEGEIDTLTLWQRGFPAIGIAGVSAFKDEYVAKFKRVKTAFLCADADEAGTKLVHRIGGLLHDKSRIVQLPAGEDVNSWVVAGHQIEALTATAKPYVDYLIDGLPDDVLPSESDSLLQPVFGVLSKSTKVAQDMYAKRIGKQIGISQATLKQALREYVEMSVNDVGKQSSNGNGNIVWKEVRVINPAQDYVDGTMYTVAFLDVLTIDHDTEERKLETVPYVVNSKREIFPLTDTEAYGRGLRITDTKIPFFSIVGRRWCIDETEPYSVKAYLDGGVTVSPWEIYQEVVGLFRRYVDYPDDLYYDFLALWSIGTYFYNLYPAYPYVHLTGTKRVGKSLTLQIIAELAFNAIHSSSMSAAAAFRTVEACSATLLLDEAENLQKKSKNDKNSDTSGDDKIEILKSGYMKGPKAIRCTGDNHEPKGFDVYSPKMFGSIESMDKVLADRAISLVLARKKKEVEEFDEQAMKAMARKMRDKLYVLMLDYGKDIVEELQAGINWQGVKDRERQLWTPILTLAAFFDQFRLDDPTNLPKRADLLTDRMQRLATAKGEEKQAKERDEQNELPIIAGVLEFVRNNVADTGNWYSTTRLCNWLKQREDTYWIGRPQDMIDVLERVTIIQHKKTEVTRILDDNKKRFRAVRLNLPYLEEIAKRYGVVE